MCSLSIKATTFCRDNEMHHQLSYRNTCWAIMGLCLFLTNQKVTDFNFKQLHITSALPGRNKWGLVFLSTFKCPTPPFLQHLTQSDVTVWPTDGKVQCNTNHGPHSNTSGQPDKPPQSIQFNFKHLALLSPQPSIHDCHTTSSERWCVCVCREVFKDV